MSDKMSTFKRYEKKFMLNAEQYETLRESLKDYMEDDRYDRYTICNIYYDTDTYEIIRRSIDKPVYKEKLRLRSYGVPRSDDKIFYELKKKYKKEVFKRRISLKMDEFENYSKIGMRPDGSDQVLNEIEYFISMYQPKPKIFIAYERTALVGIEDRSLRMTFDENLRFREDNLSLRKGDYGTRVLEKGQYLMEVKIVGAMPVWLSHLLAELKIYPTSFSKYGYCYTNYINPYGQLTHEENLIKQYAS